MSVSVQRRSRPQDRHLKSKTLPGAPERSILGRRTKDSASRETRKLRSKRTLPPKTKSLCVGRRCIKAPLRSTKPLTSFTGLGSVVIVGQTTWVALFSGPKKEPGEAGSTPDPAGDGRKSTISGQIRGRPGSPRLFLRPAKFSWRRNPGPFSNQDLYSGTSIRSVGGCRPPDPPPPKPPPLPRVPGRDLLGAGKPWPVTWLEPKRVWGGAAPRGSQYRLFCVVGLSYLRLVTHF